MRVVSTNRSEMYLYIALQSHDWCGYYIYTTQIVYANIEEWKDSPGGAGNGGAIKNLVQDTYSLCRIWASLSCSCNEKLAHILQRYTKNIKKVPTLSHTTTRTTTTATTATTATSRKKKSNKNFYVMSLSLICGTCPPLPLHRTDHRRASNISPKQNRRRVMSEGGLPSQAEEGEEGGAATWVGLRNWSLHWAFMPDLTLIRCWHIAL